MLFSFICPTRFIESFGAMGDFTLALSHLIDLEKRNQYEESIREIGLPIMLDNGLFEHHKPEALDTLIDKAIKIKALAFFSPDYLYDAFKTRDQVDIAYMKMIEKDVIDKIQLGAVVQAHNRKDWLIQYADFTNDKRIDMIGLSILSIPHAYKMPITEARIACMKDLLKLDIQHKKCHLLGLGSSYDDIKFAIENCPWIETNDSSSCFMTGLKGKVYTDNMRVPNGKIKEKMDFSLGRLLPLQMEAIHKNIQKVKQLQNDYKS